MTKKLQEGYAITIVPYKTPYNDLNFKESAVLGFLLGNFTDRKTFKRKNELRWHKNGLRKIFGYGTRLFDAILESLQEKGYIDNIPIQNQGTIFTLNDRGVQVYEDIYKPFIPTPPHKKRKERKG